MRAPTCRPWWSGWRRERRFDVVHADQLNMAQYALERGRRAQGARSAQCAVAALQAPGRDDAAGPRRWLLERDWRLLKTYEGRLVREFDAVLAVSDDDKAALTEAMGGDRDDDR